MAKTEELAPTEYATWTEEVVRIAVVTVTVLVAVTVTVKAGAVTVVAVTPRQEQADE